MPLFKQVAPGIAVEVPRTYKGRCDAYLSQFEGFVADRMVTVTRRTDDGDRIKTMPMAEFLSWVREHYSEDAPAYDRISMRNAGRCLTLDLEDCRMGGDFYLVNVE